MDFRDPDPIWFDKTEYRSYPDSVSVFDVKIRIQKLLFNGERASICPVVDGQVGNEVFWRFISKPKSMLIYALHITMYSSYTPCRLYCLSANKAPFN